MDDSMLDNDARNFQTLWAFARSSFNGLDVPAEVFREFLNARAVSPSRTSPELLKDCYLACACAEKRPQAASAFLACFSMPIEATVRRIHADPAFVDDVRQIVVVRLLVEGPAGVPAIARYGGQGSLKAFVETTARREAWKLAENLGRFAGEDDLVSLLVEQVDPESLLFKDGYRDVVNRALRLGLRGQSSRDKLILRLNLVEKIGTVRLAKMHGVDQSTISRWIQRAARDIVERTNEIVQVELQVERQDVSDIVAMVRSELELSFTRSTGLTVTLPALDPP